MTLRTLHEPEDPPGLSGPLMTLKTLSTLKTLHDPEDPPVLSGPSMTLKILHDPKDPSGT
ncbi:hypothetical protein ABVT39_009085 [Epinephelus coioides]